MKRGTPTHPKLYDLCDRLKIKRPTAVGYLELLWHFTAAYAPQGDIGKFPDYRIEAALDWSGPTGKLVAALREAGWIDEDPKCRLVVHDWHQHADDAVKKRVLRNGLSFLSVASKLTGQMAVTDRNLSSTDAVNGSQPEPSPSAGARAKARANSAPEELSTDHVSLANEVNAPVSQRGAKGDVQREPQYATALDELKAIFESKVGSSVTVSLLDKIQGHLAGSGVALDLFVSEVRRHNGHFKNFPGFLLDLSRTFRSKTAPASPPAENADQVDSDYQCPKCFSRKRGEGALVIDGKEVPCECASEEYIQKLRRPPTAARAEVDASGSGGLRPMSGRSQ